MKYGIKLKDRVGEGFFLTRNEPKVSISEHTGPKNSKLLEFDSISDAEVYAQDHEFSNYEIDRIS